VVHRKNNEADFDKFDSLLVGKEFASGLGNPGRG
jgi:hypothetical protein